MRGAVAGIDIGGTTVTGVVATPDGRVLASSTVAAMTASGGLAVLTQIPPLIAALQDLAGVKASSVGVGAAGVIEAGTGRVLVASKVFHDWVGHCLADELIAMLGVPVVVANDVNAFLMGEMRWGALRDSSDAIGVMLGTGVGGAVALERRLVEGRFGGAGEIGHTPRYSDLVCTCGGVGHLETVASGRSLALRYSELSGVETSSGRCVAEKARAGDDDARAVMTAAAEALGDALLTATTLLDVRHVVVGGGVMGAWDLLAPPLLTRIAENPPVSGRGLIVRPAELTISAMGAATLVLEAMPNGANDAPKVHSEVS